VAKSRAEQETVIRRAADEQQWDVFCEDPRVIRVLEARHGPGRAHGNGFRWLLPASSVSFPRRRQLSEQQRLDAARRLASVRRTRSARADGPPDGQ